MVKGYVKIMPMVKYLESIMPKSIGGVITCNKTPSTGAGRLWKAELLDKLEMKIWNND